MKFNSKTGFDEQDYQLVKEKVCELEALPADVKALEESAPEIDYGNGNVTIELGVPFYGFIVGHITNSPETVLNSTNLSVTPQFEAVQAPSYGNYPSMRPIVWDGEQGSYIQGGTAYLFTLSETNKPGTLTISSETNVWVIKNYLEH